VRISQIRSRILTVGQAIRPAIRLPYSPANGLRHQAREYVGEFMSSVPG
jgi:hypothetical protein